MEKEISRVKSAAQKEIAAVSTLAELEKTRTSYLGREKGALTLILRALKNLPEEKRKTAGREANLLRREIEESLALKKEKLEKAAYAAEFKKERLDVTRPGLKPERGSFHPLTKITREAVSIFSALGFEIAEGPEAETEWYNFDALNIPPRHPARDMWDTFWISRNGNKNGGTLLRTHTSPVQIRYMEKRHPPFRIVVPGRVYRYEATDASHDIQFHQLEGLMIDKNVSIAGFKAVIAEFFSRFFRTKTKIRLRPSYFPFTEPSFEVDVSCVICGEKGCPVCGRGGWLEIAGAGMVHPNVLKNAGQNPREWGGFAFGMGLTRLAMMKYKIPDIRLFHSGDLRFLKQF